MAISDKSYLLKIKKRIRATLPVHLNLAEHLSDVLGTSKEGVYRRLRGSSAFTLEEALILRKQYGISLDELTDGSENVNVSFKPLYNEKNKITTYFEDIIQRFKKIRSVPNSLTYNVCEDLPFFRQMGYPTLSKFKIFYWKHSILKDEFSNHTFKENLISPKTVALAENIFELYMKDDSVEIWTERTVSNTVRQIEYLWDCGAIDDPELMHKLYQDLIQLVKDVVNESKISKKIHLDIAQTGSFDLHLCGFSLDNNSILLTRDEPKYLAIGFNSFNSIQSMDKRLLMEYDQWLQVILSKSVKLSSQAERMRHEFLRDNLEIIHESAHKYVQSASLMV